MKTASIHEIKLELSVAKPAELLDLCLRLCKFKKENKELLTYLLFEANDEQAFIVGVKKVIAELFKEINLSQLYFAKKSLRKIARIIAKYCRYSGVKVISPKPSGARQSLHSTVRGSSGFSFM